MDCFDTILVPCPVCGEKFQAQSKSGPCELMTYEFYEAPDDVLEDVNRHAPFECDCGALFDVRLTIVQAVRFLSQRILDEI